MTVAVEQEKEMADYSPEESKINPSDYDCQILLEKTTIEIANDKSYPTDARLVWYIVDGKIVERKNAEFDLVGLKEQLNQRVRFESE